MTNSIGSRRRCVGLVTGGMIIGLALSGCDPTVNQSRGPSEWLEKTARFYSEHVRVDLGDLTGEPGSWRVGAVVPAVRAGSLYVSALALGSLGPQMRSVLSDTELNEIVGRFTGDSASDYIETPGSIPPEYVLWELAWADEMGSLLSDSEAEKLVSIFLGGGLRDDDTEPDLTDVRVAMEAEELLGVTDSDLTAEAQAVVDGMSELLCHADLSDESVVSALVDVASMKTVSLSCPSRLEQGWSAGVELVRGESHQEDGSPGYAANLLVSLELMRLNHWPEDSDRRAQVVELFNGLTPWLDPSLKVNSICRGNYWGSSMWVPT